MYASSSIRESRSVLVALREATLDALERLEGKPQIAIVFVSGEDCDSIAPQMLEMVAAEIGRAPVIGGVVDSIIGIGKELERQTAASVMLLGGMDGEPKVASLECTQTPDGWSVLGIDEELHGSAAACGGLLVIACPKTFSVDILNQSLETWRTEGDPIVPILGGNLDRGSWKKETILFAGDRITQEGAVTIAMPSSVQWSTVVSQGCRPIGEPMVITEARDGMIVGLGGRPALDRLRETFNELPNREREMAMRLLLLGRAISEYSETFSHGEFLIRNITSVDRETKGIAVADRVRVGQTVRFHLVDTQAADADLRQLLKRAESQGLSPQAACMFTCNGRGERLFGEPHHDASVLNHYFQEIPTIGFFASGEFGPVAGHNLVHGFTAVIGLLCDKVKG
jgi:small ligand-binding sensory domain FIST